MRKITIVMIGLLMISTGFGFAGGRPQQQAPTPELRIWVDEARTQVIRELGTRFEAQYGVRVSVQTMGFGDIRDQLKIAGPVGEGPDILLGAHDWLGELVENGLLEPIQLGANQNKFLDAAITGFTYDGVLFGMPYATDNVALVRNTQLVPQPPRTFSELTQIARRLRSEGRVRVGFIRQTGDPYHFHPILTAFGGYIFGLESTGFNDQDVGIDSAGGIRAATWLMDLQRSGDLLADVDYDVMHGMFERGEAAMIITGPWAIERLMASGVPFEVSAIPSEQSLGRPFLGVQGFMVSAFSQNKLLAQTFLNEYLATEQAMNAIFQADPRPSAFLSVRNAITDPKISAFAEAGKVGIPMPAIPAMSAVWSAFDDALVLITQGRLEGPQAFRNAANQIRNAIR
jgi:arabinogalactan oligomer/maltooligosaccharide transport system substrate-binding protein